MHVRGRWKLILLLCTTVLSSVANAKQCNEESLFGSTSIFSDCRGAEAISSAKIESNLALEEAFDMVLTLLESNEKNIKSTDNLYISVVSLMQSEDFKFRVTSFPNGILLASNETSAVFLRIDDNTWFQKTL